MPELCNRNDHGVRVYDENGQSIRLRAGQVQNVDGVAADRLLAYDGVETASSDDKEAWDAKYPQMNAVTSGKESLDEQMADARVHARAVGVAVPLNTVIGDDDAPMGPPSGTITTKAAVAAEGPEEKRAFADHERLPEEAENEKLSDVEREQAEAAARLEEVHQEALAEHREAQEGGDAEESKPKRGGRKAKQQEE